MFIKPAHLNALKIIERRHGPIYIVGAALRHALLKPPSPSYAPRSASYDIDLAVRGSAKDAAFSFAKITGSTVVALDIFRGIYRAVPKSEKDVMQYDFASMNGLSVAEDLVRRDCTINALALPLAHVNSSIWRRRLIDPSGGCKDLKKRIVRSHREANLMDDPLRLLRLFRAAAEIKGRIHPQTLAWALRHKSRIRRAAPERIRNEFLKLLSCPKTAGLIKTMDGVRLLTQIFPILERGRNLAPQYYKQGGVLGHEIAALECYEKSVDEMSLRWPKIAKPVRRYLAERVSGGFCRYALIKLAVLLHDVAKPHTARVIDGRMRFFGHDKRGAVLFKKIGGNLRCSNDEIELIGKIINSHLRPGNLSEQPAVSDRAVYRFFRDLGEDGIGVLLNALADHQSYMNPKNQWSLKEKAISVIKYLLDQYFGKREQVMPKPIIDGHDVMKKAGIEAGPKVGQLLDLIRQSQAEGKIKTRQEALLEIKKIAASLSG
ncbi:MAG: HD domain-containing protein [Elusimicrobia bacterium]|nr:HD domain-containing protein [Elusimicrobiota bacterium]